MTVAGPANYVKMFPEANLVGKPMETPTPLDSVKEASERIIEVTKEIRRYLERLFPRSGFDISFSFDEKKMVAIRIASKKTFRLSESQENELKKSLWRFKCYICVVSTSLPSGGSVYLLGTNLKLGSHVRNQAVIDNIAKMSKKNPPRAARG